ncbi:MAG TPA: PhzF family phenazine biosynthesis protein, partial [Acidimicrobiales bacterium]|nr:PhzF family phenazine biosynthesis protein [Acidimicrobiales bacterium]
WIEMDFPAWDVAEAALPAGLPDGIAPPLWTGAAADDWLLELATPADVIEARPDLAAVAAQGRRAFIVTARAGQEGAVGAAAPGVPPGADFVSRVFAPNAGIPEDPVTGSAHCALGPYWAARLGGDELVGYQASARGGTVRIRIAGEGVAPGRLGIAGQAVAVSEVKLLV